MKTKTVTITATREYVAQEVVTFELAVPDFDGLGNSTIQHIAQDYIRNTHWLGWEHDESRETKARAGSLVVKIEDADQPRI
jgi:hypothetical protein